MNPKAFGILAVLYRQAWAYFCHDMTCAHVSCCGLVHGGTA